MSRMEFWAGILLLIVFNLVLGYSLEKAFFKKIDDMRDLIWKTRHKP